MAFGEGVPGTGLEVRLEGDSLIFRLEGEVGLDFPRFEFCGVCNVVCVVFLQPRHHEVHVLCLLLAVVSFCLRRFKAPAT